MATLRTPASRPRQRLLQGGDTRKADKALLASLVVANEACEPTSSTTPGRTSATNARQASSQSDNGRRRPKATRSRRVPTVPVLHYGPADQRNASSTAIAFACRLSSGCGTLAGIRLWLRLRCHAGAHPLSHSAFARFHKAPRASSCNDQAKYIGLSLAARQYHTKPDSTLPNAALKRYQRQLARPRCGHRPSDCKRQIRVGGIFGVANFHQALRDAR